jgi:hypothetical protein
MPCWHRLAHPNQLALRYIFSRQARQDRKENHNSLYLNLKFEFLGALCVFARENNA